MTAQRIADMANAAEAAALMSMTNEMREWYMSLPRATRVEIAVNAAHETLKSLKGA